MSWLEKARFLETSIEGTDKTDNIHGKHPDIPKVCTDKADNINFVSNVSTLLGPFQKITPPEKTAESSDLVRVIDGETHRLTQAEIDYETSHVRVTCLRCQHLARHGVCRGRGFIEHGYYPLAYVPEKPWRRCDEYLAAAG